MCLDINRYIHTGITPITHISEDNKIVFKLLNGDNTSYIKGYKYKSNMCYTLGKPLVPIYRNTHLPYSLSPYFEPFDVYEGFHAYFLYKSMHIKYTEGCKLVKFIIPKGAHYYIGNEGDIVSDSIISLDLEELKYGNH